MKIKLDPAETLMNAGLRYIKVGNMLGAERVGRLQEAL
jgi:hypothetical protein